MRKAAFATAILAATASAALAQNCPSAPPAIAGAGFTTSNGQIIGPNGVPFIAKGINVYADNLSTVVPVLTSTMPGINFVRVNVFDMSTDTAAKLKPYVDALTSQGITVELEDHNYPTVLSGGDLAAAAQRYADWATTFKNNPGVVFGTQNEPSTGGGDIATEISTIYNAIRATGNNTLVMVNPYGGYSLNGIDTSIFGGMTNVAMDLHYYNWLSNNSTSLAANQSALANEIAGAQSVNTADGKIPVIIGEYGNAAAQSMDPGGMQVVQAVEDSGYGSVAWAWQSGNTSDGGPVIPADLVSPPWTGGQSSLTPFGQAVAQYFATCSGSAPIVIPQAQGTASQNASLQAALPPRSTAPTAQSGSGQGCPGMTMPGAVTPGSGSFSDAAGNLYAIDANNGDVASVNGAPINNGAYETSQLTQGSDGTIYGQDENSHQWFELMGSSGDTWWQPLASVPAAIMSAGPTVASATGANPCSGAMPQNTTGQLNPMSGVLPNILQTCADPATIANPMNADLCSKAFANQAMLDQISAQLAGAQQAAAGTK